MRRMIVFICVVCLVAGGAPPLASHFAGAEWQSAAGQEPDAAPTETKALASQSTGDSDQAQWCVEGIVDRARPPEERKRWANRLLSLGSAELHRWVVELLQLAENPGAQQAMCEALAGGAREHPEWLDPGFVDPLLDLLEAETDELRRAAAVALARYPGPEVPKRLSVLAAEPETPLVKRLAAIDALAVNTHRREVVGQLVRLLDSAAPEVHFYILQAVQAASRQPFDSDPDRCRAWWSKKAELSEEAWLADQVRMYQDRLRSLQTAVEAERVAAMALQTEVAARLGEFQSELFRALNPQRQNTKLAEWLSDPLEPVQLTALSKIKARIADEGQRPQGAVLEGLLRLLKQGAPAVRREVLLIAQNLGDPAVVDAILAQLAVERDPGTRLAIFKALGRLQSPRAIPALIEEIASEQSRPDCVQEAASALGLVAGKATDDPMTDETVTALKRRYAAVSADDLALRAAILEAMAGVADATFAAEFQAALECDESSLLKPAIQGLQAIGDASQIPRFRTLTASQDPGVRLVAIEAIGRLGHEDADLEAILSRLNPAIEDSEPARRAAWRAFTGSLGRKPVQERIKWAQRLHDLNDLELRYLQELAGELAATNGNTAGLETVRDRLALAHVGRGQYALAIPHLEALYATQSVPARRDDPGAPALEVGLRLLEAMLYGRAYERAADLVRQLADSATEPPQKERIVTTVGRYIATGWEAGPTAAGDREGAAALLAAMRTVPAGLLGDSYTQLLDQLAHRLESAHDRLESRSHNEPTPDTSP